MADPTVRFPRIRESDVAERRQRKLLISLYRQSIAAEAFGFAAMLVTVFLFWPFVPHYYLIPWAAWLIMLTSVRVSMILYFLRSVRKIRNTRAWEFGFDIGAALNGLTWGTGAFVFSFEWPLVYQVYVFVVFTGLAGATLSAYSASIRAYGLFLSGLIGPFFMRLAIGDNPSATLFALLLLAFAMCMFVLARGTHRSVASNLSLRLVNDDLIDSLTQTNDDLSREVTQRRAAQADLQQERKLFLQGPAVVFRWLAEEGWPIEYVSPNVSQFGLDAKQLMRGRVRYAELVHPEDVSVLDQAEYQRDDKTHYEFIEQDYRLVLPSGEIRWVYDHSIAVKDEFGNTTHFDGYLLDITDRKHAEQSLREEKERVQVTLHSIDDGVITTNVDDHVTYMNPIAEQLTGIKLDNARGQPLTEIFRAYDPETDLLMEDSLTRVEDTHDDEMGYVRLRSKHGEYFDVTYSVAPIRDHRGSSIGQVMVLRDTTQTLAMSRELAHRASHDDLTQTLNRSEFEVHVQRAVDSAREQGMTHALLYIDLDQFKVVNDTCGHGAGDELLKRISGLLERNIRKSDLLARLGGDEFAVLLHRCSLRQANAIAEKLRKASAETRFAWEDKLFEVGLSIGIVAINIDSASPSMLLSAADMACYTAKDLGRNRVHTYQASDSELARRHSEMEWVSRINAAIEENRLILFAQEIQPAVTDPNALKRHEILLRMCDPNGELIGAQAFLPAAERFNLAPTIDRWVIHETLKFIHQGKVTDSLFYINISGMSLSQADLLPYIKEQFAIYKVAGSQACFEITETAAISHATNAHTFINELKGLGCYFALDDFGSGLSSFSYLKDLPVDYLKIDGSFVQNIVQDSVDRALVAAINDVGHTMLIDTVAEYVESNLVLNEVRKIGIDYVQGNYIGEPKPLPNQVDKLRRLRSARGHLRVVGED